MPNVVGNSVSWALYFFLYSRIKATIGTYTTSGDLSYYHFFAASGTAGMLQRNSYPPPIVRGLTHY